MFLLNSHVTANPQTKPPKWPQMSTKVHILHHLLITTDGKCHTSLSVGEENHQSTKYSHVECVHVPCAIVKLVPDNQDLGKDGTHET